MERWYHRVAHSDGSHYHMFNSEAAALAGLVKGLGYDTDDFDKPLRANHSYIDDNGGRHVVEAAPRGVKTAATMVALERAYDARECGTANGRQLALLNRYGQ